MGQMQVGAYVRCSIELEYPSQPRKFALGQVIVRDDVLNLVRVQFYAHNNQKEYYDVYEIPEMKSYPIEEVEHVKILDQSPAVSKKLKTSGVVIHFSHEDAVGLYHYYFEYADHGIKKTAVVSEKDLVVPFTRGDMDAIQMALQYEFHQPMWYLQRQIVTNSLHTLKNAAFGFETLIGSRVFLMRHQVDTIVRAIGEDPCRFMLADEVGLGKTIEAAVIMKGLQRRIRNLTILIIAPKSLVLQWRNEMSYKFWIDFEVYDGSPASLTKDLLLFPLEELQTAAGRNVLERNWGLCIIDETHRLLRMEKEYELILQLSRQVKHILLLSATPIQSREEEFLRLVSLLEPDKYGNMNKKKFADLLEKQDYLRKKVHQLMRDLPDYAEDDLAEEFKEDLEAISDRLNDNLFKGIVAQMDPSSEDQGLGQAKFALAYLGEHYQIERKIIRHRRKEIEQELPRRTLDERAYLMSGSDEGYFESDTYEALLDYLLFMRDACEADSRLLAGFVRLYLAAVFSSPWALLALLEARKQGRTDGTDLPAVPGEQELIDLVIHHATRWLKATENELARLKELYDEPYLIKGRLALVMDYVMSETIDEKIVIFSNFKETLLPLEAKLIEEYGSDAVRSFYMGKNEKELQQAVDDFQNDLRCRFMLCDPLGGEGRNFQMADRILHVDLPWSPSDLEQRIGRLDRIGRKGEVLSVVFYTEQTLEEDLMKIWKDGLGLFNESISGIEIAIQDIQDEISRSLMTDLRFGLGTVIEKTNAMLQFMRERVEEERYFDLARQLDAHVEDQLLRLIAKFDNNGGSTLASTMMEWSSMTGLRGESSEKGKVVVFREGGTSINSMKRTLFVLPDTKEALRRAKRIGEVRGTFIREVAVAREGLVFFAPGDPFFDSIVNNAYETDWGRCTALEVKNAPFAWEGFVYTWSVSVNPKPLLSRNLSLDYLVYAQGYVPLEHFITAEGLPAYEAAQEYEVIALLKQVRKPQVVHLGERSNGNIDRFAELYPSDLWTDMVQNSFSSSKSKLDQHIRATIDLQRVSNDFQMRVNARKASNLYYNRQTGDELAIQWLKQVFDALYEGVADPLIRLESIAYVRMVKSVDL